MSTVTKATWLLAAALFAPPSGAGQLLVDHVHGATLAADGKLHRFEAMLVQDGKVVATGSHEAMAARAAPGGAVLDGKGRWLLPGLIDAHGHLNNLGKLRIFANLVGTSSREEALARVRDYAAAHPDDAWVLGRGWNETLWSEPRLPTAADLDAVVPDRPAGLRRVDGHAGWGNSAALKAAGIGRDSPDPPGGRIERDARGEPTGVLVDAALDLLERAIPPQSPQQLAAALDAALAEMASVGLTGVGDPGIDQARYALYRRYADEGKLSARVYAMIDDVGADFDAISAQGPLLSSGDDRLSVRAVKLYADGALGSRGAALLAPYSDLPGQQGTLFESTDSLAAKIAKATGKGYQVAVHAIGDAANHQVLDAFEQVYRTQPQAKRLRNRIEHAQVVALDDIPRFKSLGIIASMQPTHATSDMNMAQARVGPARLRGAYAWRRFLDQGTPVAGGSDFPVESTNPFFGIHAAVTRQDHAGQPPGGWHPEQAMTRLEALRAFTLDAAYAEHAEARIGSLEPGKWADFILVDRDLFAIAPEELWQVQVLETWVGGQRVYLAPTAAAAPALGSISFPTSTTSPEAQAAFVEGMLLWHVFEYADAAKAFQKAQALDPDLAMAYWGEAMTYTHPVWNQQDLAAGRAALAKLGATPQARAARAPTPRERDFLHIAELLYGEGDKAARDLQVLAASEDLAQRYPRDDEAQLLLSLSLLGADQGVRNLPRFLRAADIAKAVYRHNPRHPGAAHFWIHGLDDPAHAQGALEAARALAKIAPGAGHSQHMTSHIFVALGMWQDVVDSNLAAAAVVNAGLRAKGQPPYSCGHYAEWLQYAWFQLGREREGVDVLQRCAREGEALLAWMRAHPGVPVLGGDLAKREPYQAGTLAAMRATALAEAPALAQEVLAMRLPAGDMGNFSGLLAFAEGLELLRGEDADAAVEPLAQLRALAAAAPAAGDNGSSRKYAATMAHLLSGLLAQREGRVEAGLQEVRAAADEFDALPFDFGPPATLKPPREVLGEMLLAAGRKAEARVEFAKALQAAPRRRASLQGLARASAN